MTAIQGSSASTDIPLPADKLSPSLPSDVDQKPVVLVNCGSFNPPTIMHLRMFDVAAQVLRKVLYNQVVCVDPEKHVQLIQQDKQLLGQERCLSSSALAEDMIMAMLCVVEDVIVPIYLSKQSSVLTTNLTLQAGHAVLGGYASPVNDAYHKPGLLPSQHRIAMCQLAADESDLVMVDTWEAAQAQAQRSLIVLQHVQRAVREHYDDISRSQQQMPTAGSTSEHPQNSASQQVSRQVGFHCCFQELNSVTAMVQLSTTHYEGSSANA